MRHRRLLISGAFVVACSGLAVQAAHRIKWSEAGQFNDIRTAVDPLLPRLPLDSPVALRAVGLPDDCFHYLRYCVIPRPLHLKMPTARRVLLLSTRADAQAASDRLAYERPDLRRVAGAGRGGLFLTLYEPAL